MPLVFCIANSQTFGRTRTKKAASVGGLALCAVRQSVRNEESVIGPAIGCRMALRKNPVRMVDHNVALAFPRPITGYSVALGPVRR